MLYTFETRIQVDQELDALLASNAQHWNFGLRKAWALLYRERLPRTAAYAALTKLGFTSHQVGSLLTSAEMKYKALTELKKYEAQQLELGIEKRERAILDKLRKIKDLEKRQLKLRAQRDAWAPKDDKARTKRYIEVLAKLRTIDRELAFCRNWAAQKSRALEAKQGKLTTLRRDLTSGHISLCFGSKKLLAQRPGPHNPASPYASLDAWRADWEAAREGQWWSVGHTDKPQGNAEVQWDPDSKQLRLRLTDKLAHERMDARGVPHSGTQQKFMPMRMQCRFATIEGVDFPSHKGFAREALKQSFGNRPVTMRVLSRRLADGTRAWYIQASVDVPHDRNTEPRAGVLGLDFNARGVAWCAVKPDGNRQGSENGFAAWSLKGRPKQARKHAIGETAAQLARHAKRLNLAVSLENLDFATRKASARAGSVNRPYNEMLGALPTSQFAQALERACERLGVPLYSVNPSYSSVGGFTKYGRINRMDADRSAALWLGRQALFGEVYRTDGVRHSVKKFDEQLVFSHLPVTPMQCMTAQAGAQWRDAARGLGVRRREWGANFHRWLTLQVETAPSLAPRAPEQPLSPLATG